MQNFRRWLRCLAILWILSRDPCYPFVPLYELTSPQRNNINKQEDPGYFGLVYSFQLWAVKFDTTTAKNQTEENDVHLARPMHSLSTEIATIQPILNGNGVPLYGFEEEVDGATQKVLLRLDPNEKELDRLDGALQASGAISEQKTRSDLGNASGDMPYNRFDDNSQTPFNPDSVSENETKEDLVPPVDVKVEPITESMPMRLLWRRRRARTMEEGIRRQRATKLSSLLKIDGAKNQERQYVERILMGLINAVAEEIEDLDVELTADERTPLWRKELNEVRISFSRLGFKPLRMGGSNMPDQVNRVGESETTNLSLIECADEAFDRIDKDNSGTLDREEIAEALTMISADLGDRESMDELASELVELYDTNSDGVVDREEYQLMIEDMASLRPKPQNPLSTVKQSAASFAKGISQKAAAVASAATRSSAPDDTPSPPAEKEEGSIVLSDLNLDLRRLVFGGVPILKKLTPGGPLILEPFTVTMTGSFSREDVMGSFLLDSGLRLLVARVLRVRMRKYRDLVDGAYIFGRQWKMTSKSAPVVEVLGLSNVEFDAQDKMIVTGRARIRASPDAPVVKNTFKVRTKIGTGKRGQTIRLVEPELAFVFECPRAWENGLKVACEKLGMPPPKRPEPFYSFFPIYSPLKVTDENAGFDMGDDNKLRQIFIKDGKLRFQMSSVLRPGRFLGNHYIAFTLPMRTFIITMDRVREGARTARKNKKIAAREKQLSQKDKQESTFSVERVAASARRTGRLKQVLERFLRNKRIQKPTKSFFSRFVEGYTLIEREGDAKSERFANEISDWFGRQGSPNATSVE